jgi:hypothetical protein
LHHALVGVVEGEAVQGWFAFIVICPARDIPFPLIVAVWGAPGALVLMETVAERVPTAEGVNVKTMLQLWTAATFAPLKQVLAPETAKSAAFAPLRVALLLKFRFPVPVFVIVMVAEGFETFVEREKDCRNLLRELPMRIEENYEDSIEVQLFPTPPFYHPPWRGGEVWVRRIRTKLGFVKIVTGNRLQNPNVRLSDEPGVALDQLRFYARE